MKVSLCLSTFNKPEHLKRTLASILAQRPPFDWEVIVVDDGGSPENRDICLQYPLHYGRIEREHVFRNPGPARNVAYRKAKGEIIIAQSDDVVHATPDCIERLVEELTPGHFVIATVYHTDELGNVVPDGATTGKLTCYTSPNRPRPLFFLGALWRRDLYAVGGNDEAFVEPGGEDRWFGACLLNGPKLKPRFSTRAVGHHIRHARAVPYHDMHASRNLFDRKYREASRGRIPWCAAGGPWPWTDPT